MDFEIEVKYDSGVNSGQQTGVYIEQDATNLLRLEFLGTGSNT